MYDYEEIAILEYTPGGELIFSNNMGERLLNEFYEMNLKYDLFFFLNQGSKDNILKTFKQTYAFGVVKGENIKLLFIPLNTKVNSIENYIDTTSLRHEIKNPLTAISGVVQVVDAKYNDLYLKKCMDIIKSECDRINNLMININFISDMQINYKKTDIILLLSKIVDKFKVIYPDISISLVVDESVRFINIDSEKIGMALNNILKNALEAEGTSSISVKYFLDPSVRLRDRQKNVFKKIVKFCIKDNGNGMDEGTIKKLFTPFYTTKNKGSGLGLVITKEILERHDGKIEYKSIKGEGTEFLIYLPV